MRIQKENTIAIGIDLQTKLIPAIYENNRLILNCEKLLKGLNILKIHCLFTQQYTKGLGETVSELKNIMSEKTKIFEKSTFSAFENTVIKKELEEFFQKQGAQNILLFGVESHVCVIQTLIDLCSHGYQAVLIENCIGSRNLPDKKAAVRRAVKEGAIVTTYEQILFELMRTSEDPFFRDLLKIVK